MSFTYTQQGRARTVTLEVDEVTYQGLQQEAQIRQLSMRAYLRQIVGRRADAEEGTTQSSGHVLCERVAP